jgi:RHS repeat-associated protein
MLPGFNVSSTPNLTFVARIGNNTGNATAVINTGCEKYGKIVISEIHFDTHYSEQIDTKYHHFGEYIELYNSSNVAVDLNDWVIKDNHTRFKFSNNQYNQNLIIQPGGYKIITYNGFYAYGQLTQAGAPSAIGGREKFVELFPELAPLIANQDFDPLSDIILQNTMVLYNDTDIVSLYAPNGKIIDEIAYENRDDPTITLAFPNALRISPKLDNGDGHVFNGPIGSVPQLDSNGIIVIDPNTGLPFMVQKDEYKQAIYRSTIDSYYTNGAPITIAVATASPASMLPQITIPLRDLDPFLFYTPDNSANSTESIVYDIKDGSIIGQSKTYFDDLGKPKVSLSKDFQNNKVWGSEVVYDNFGRKSKESFPTTSCMDFDNINFLSDSGMKSRFLDKYYSNNNTQEGYQATAEQPYSEVNYDTLNPGNVINVVGGNKIDDGSGTPQWKTGFSYTVPAAQEMYYAFGSNYFNDNRDVNYHLSTLEDKTFPTYDNLGMTHYWTKVVTSQADMIAASLLPSTTMPSGGELFDVRVNSPLEIGKIYKVTRFGVPCLVQVLKQPATFRDVTTAVGTPLDVLAGNWATFSDINYYYSLDYVQQTTTVLNNSNNIIAGLKAFKSIGIDANGVENVSFSDSDGKSLAAARSGGTIQYPVTSLIGNQGFVDIHLPKGCDGTLVFLGGAALYNVYNLRTGALLTDPEKANMAAGVYRVELINNTNPLSLTYIDKTTGTINLVSPTSKGVTYKVNYYDYTINIYNKTGQLLKNVQPNGYQANATIVATPSHMTAAGFASSYLYNDQGQVKQVTSADEGTSKFLYRQDGQIRYSQSALQAGIDVITLLADTKVSYTDYDTYGRPIESGVITSTSTGIWAAASANPDGALISGPNLTRSEQTFTVYDYAANNTTSVMIPTALTLSSVLTAEGISPTNYNQNNLSGNVAITYSKTGATINAITWYSYDLYGRSEWIVQYNEGLGAKTIHYQYDYKGNVKKVLFQKDKATELFVHQYTYNLNNVLTKVETSKDNSTFITHADYDYYVSGELKRVNIAQGAQGLDYVYTLGGQLKSINHPSLEQAKDPGHDANDVFGLTLDYYNGDYQRANTNIASSPTIAGTNQDFNGNIKAARWANKTDISTGAGQQAYVYNYNRNGWMTDATFGATNNTGAITTATKFKEGALTYDANGNIKTLQRSNEAGTVTDNLVYNYTNPGTNPGTNQLKYVTENAAVTADLTDIENQAANNYSYDVLGQMTRNVKEDINYFYNTQGLVTEVQKAGHAVVKMFYNERGQRVKKESYNTSTFALTSTDYYALDISGNAMAIYNKPAGSVIAQNELPIYGLSRLGVYMKSSNPANDYMNYQITDHLGNVRAIIKKVVNNPIVAIYSYADYYPFGEKLPTRDNITGNYRYAYQGQELDGETGMEAFQLRLWDGRLGRWLSPDPAGQYASPYLGMGNNPVSRIDPDGGSDYPERDGYSSGETWNDADGSWEWNGSSWIGQNGTTSNWLSQIYVTNKQPEMLSQWNPDFFQRWGMSENILAQGSYDFVNSIGIGAQFFMFRSVGDNSIRNVDGSSATSRDTGDAMPNLASLAVGGMTSFIKSVATEAIIGSKLQYVFGKATGNAHNIERSTGMLRQLESIGIFDNVAGRTLLRSNLASVYTSSEGILANNGRILRESLLMGPNGAVKVESIWEGNKLITVKLFGGN